MEEDWTGAVLVPAAVVTVVAAGAVFLLFAGGSAGSWGRYWLKSASISGSSSSPEDSIERFGWSCSAKGNKNVINANKKYKYYNQVKK